jgi:TMEM175 potassium channel family protein
MKMHYNRFAGQSLERVAALSDGIFAVAMTLLVLNLTVPAALGNLTEQPLWAGNVIHSEAELLKALAPLLLHLLTYFISFLTLGMFWVGQQTQLNHFIRSDRTLTWLHLLFLLTISLMPFSTALLAEFITYRVALVIYWLNLLLPGIALLGSIRYAWRAQLVKEEATDAARAALERRIVVAQILYAIAILFSIFNTYVSIAIIVLLQLSSAIAGRFSPLNRL